MKKTLNRNFHKSRKAKNDEFYTQLSDIEKELKHYKQSFKDKIVFCNCDDPEESNFWNFFSLNFEYLRLKKLVSTHFEKEKSSYKLELLKDINKDGKINKLDIVKTKLKQNGDFRSPECIEILKEVDIVVTNPPFSLFREYVAQLIEYKKKFIIVGHIGASSYKEIFKLIKDNKIWLGHKRLTGFRVPVEYPLNSPGIRIDENGNKYAGAGAIWYTNIEIKKHQENLILYKMYYEHESEYPKYDNYDAINVDRTKDIPMDYYSDIGVPITFLEKYNPEQFTIIKFRSGNDNKDLRIEGKGKYARIIIKRKKILINL